MILTQHVSALEPCLVTHRHFMPVSPREKYKKFFCMTYPKMYGKEKNISAILVLSTGNSLAFRVIFLSFVVATHFTVEDLMDEQ